MTSNNTTSQASSHEADTSQKKTGKKANKGVKLASLAIIISLALSGGVATYSYKLNQDNQAQLIALQTAIQAQQTASSTKLIEQLNTAGKKLSDETKKQLAQQNSTIEGLQTALTKMKRSPDDWLIAEADYLVRMAGRKLTLERDVVTATELLKDANQRIAELNDPSLLELRHAMTNDIAKLQNVPLIDKDGLVLKLSTLEQQIDHFPLANAILPDENPADNNQVTSDISDWKSNLLLSLKDFSAKFITVRVRDGDAIPLLSPKQDFFLRENLKTKLETAIRAILEEHQDIYTTSVGTVIQWASAYLNTNDSQVKQFIQTLKQIEATKVQVSYPSQLESQTLMTNVMHQRVRKQVTDIMEQTTTTSSATPQVTEEAK